MYGEDKSSQHLNLSAVDSAILSFSILQLAQICPALKKGVNAEILSYIPTLSLDSIDDSLYLSVHQTRAHCIVGPGHQLTI